MKFLGAMYAVALPSNAYAVLYPGSHIESSWGQIALPGFDIIEFDIATAHGGKLAGKAQREPHDPHRGTWMYHVAMGEWEHVSLHAHGTYPCLFTADGTLALADPTHNGSQGWRYVAEDGRLVTGDDTLNAQRRVGLELGLSDLWEYSHFAGVTIGQGDPPMGCHVLIDGTRRMLEPGETSFIRVKYADGIWAVSMTKLAERQSVIRWLTRAELSMLPTLQPITSIPVTPTPPVTPQPEPVMPESLIDSLRAERAKYGATLTKEQQGQLLNAVAWKHRADGWGLSTKRSGNNVPSPQGVPIAYDILHHQPTDTLWDAATAESEYRITWGQAEHHHNPDRPWLAPIAPAGETPQPEPSGKHAYFRSDDERNECDICNEPREAAIHQVSAPPQPPSGQPVPNTELAKRVDALERRLERLENAGLLVAQVYKP